MADFKIEVPDLVVPDANGYYGSDAHVCDLELAVEMNGKRVLELEAENKQLKAKAEVKEVEVILGGVRHIRNNYGDFALFFDVLQKTWKTSRFFNAELDFVAGKKK
jgi:hypothetical protein